MHLSEYEKEQLHNKLYGINSIQKIVTRSCSITLQCVNTVPNSILLLLLLSAGLWDFVMVWLGLGLLHD
jgi:hypothetical protein